jgi:hypothetical protein
MAKKDTYLALLRRGIDDTTAQQLADAGLKIGDLKKIDRNMLIENYALKPDIADGVISIINSAHSSHGKERFLASVLAPEKKVDSKIEEIKFKRKQKDVLTELAEQKERLKIAKVEAFRGKKLIMNRLGKTVELIINFLPRKASTFAIFSRSFCSANSVRTSFCLRLNLISSILESTFFSGARTDARNRSLPWEE